MAQKVKDLTLTYANDRKTAAALNEQGILSATGKPFTKDMSGYDLSTKYRYMPRTPRGNSPSSRQAPCLPCPHIWYTIGLKKIPSQYEGTETR